MRVQCIPKATLGRLPIYLKYLKSVGSTGKNISATQIAKALGYGDVQVRKDLGSVSGQGRPKVGYDTNELIKSLESCLGQKNICKAVLVGAGKLGRALLDYEGFSDFGLEIVAAFDNGVEKTEYSDVKKPIYPMNEFADFCCLHDIKIGIITVPGGAAQAVCDIMVKNNITAIWSFSPEELHVPDSVFVRRENLALSLAHLYRKV